MAGKTSFFNQSGLAGVAFSEQGFEDADGHALEYTRLNAAESVMEFITGAALLADVGGSILTELVALEPVPNGRYLYTNGSGNWAVDSITGVARALINDNTYAAMRTTLGLEIGVDVQAYDATILVDADIGVNVEAYDATILKDADIGVSVQAYDATILVDADIGVNVEAYDATILKDADIGSTVQAFDTDLSTWAGLTPSANAQSLVTAATYAAMRTLLDLEAGTDFYSKTAADAAFQAIDADTAKTDVVNDWTASQSGEVTALSDGANIALNLALSNNFSVTLGGNRTLDNPTNIVVGQSGILAVTQDGTGTRTLAYGTFYKFAGGTDPVLSTAAASVDTLAYYVKSSTEILVSAGLDWS